ncbi:MAG: AAC(3) family N-acetyltransferase [SAR202 cluster bacterium]|nr:AAC(3) family N-acetyltransferase [SAR202 cluster bacterium]
MFKITTQEALGISAYCNNRVVRWRRGDEMKQVQTRETLKSGLRELGLEEGDTVWVHSSFKSLGSVEGGAGTVVAAFEDIVGASGLIAMPSFNLVNWEDRTKTWDVGATRSTAGWITEFFRKMPGTHRSDHYSHSVAARGEQAEQLVSGHLLREGLRSRWDRGRWGYAFGTNSPMWRLYQREAKVIMLGVDYESSTYTHIAECLYRARHLDSNGKQGDHPFTNLTRVGEFWEEVGAINYAKVGDATTRLFSAARYVDTMLDQFESDIDAVDVRYLPPPEGLLGA